MAKFKNKVVLEVGLPIWAQSIAAACISELVQSGHVNREGISVAMRKFSEAIKHELDSLLDEVEMLAEVEADPETSRKAHHDHRLDRSVADMGMSVRATHCLESGGVTTVRDLVIRNEEQLFKIPYFGHTILQEVKIKLQEQGLQLAERT